MTSRVDDVVLPGDELPEIQELAKDNKKIILGDGVRFVYKFSYFLYHTK